MHQQIQEYLLDLPLRAQDKCRLRRQPVLQSQFQRLPLRLAKLHQSGKKRVHIEVPGIGILGTREGNQPRHDLGGAPRFRRQQPQVVFRQRLPLAASQRRLKVRRKL